MRESINTILVGSTGLSHPKCLLYDPLSPTEGTCGYDKATVNIQGCNHPKDCDRYTKFLATKQ